LSDAKNWGIHTFISTSALHMKHKLQMEPKDVKRCKGHGRSSGGTGKKIYGLCRV